MGKSEREGHRQGAIMCFVIASLLGFYGLYEALTKFDMTDEIKMSVNILLVLVMMCGGFIGFIYIHKKE